MLQSLFRRAEASVDNAIANALARALVAVPFLVAGGFATAGIAIYVYSELGAANGNLVMAGVFGLIGLVTAVVVATRMRPAVTPPVPGTEGGPGTDGEKGAHDPALQAVDRELLTAAVTTVAPLALPALLRVVVSNLPLVAAVAMAGFMLTRPQEPGQQRPMQPAE